MRSYLFEVKEIDGLLVALAFVVDDFPHYRISLSLLFSVPYGKGE